MEAVQKHLTGHYMGDIKVMSSSEGFKAEDDDTLTRGSSLLTSWTILTVSSSSSASDGTSGK